MRPMPVHPAHAFKMHLHHLSSLLCAAGIALVVTPTARAVPVLQLYIEGAVYDSASESWDISFQAGSSVRLWAIGNLAGAGGKGALSNVRLAVAYDHVTSGPAPSITLTPTQVGSAYSMFGDLNPAATPLWLQTVTTGVLPRISNSRTLAPHGVYGPGTDWQEFLLGNFTAPDSYGGDFIHALPTPSATLGYQINAYDIAISGTERVHFDLYGIDKKSKAIFAPFSHDATARQTPASSVPDGGLTFALYGQNCRWFLFLENFY
jgi:hypothetical protein